MAKLIGEISVFFPAYNLEEYIKDTVQKAQEFIPTIAGRYEIMVVNDGSTDKTAEILSGLLKKYPSLKVIAHPKNLGYGAALKSGFYNAKYKWIAFSDGDGQFDITELPKFIEEQKRTNADLVIGYYLKRRVSVLTVVTSKVWEFLVFFLFGLKVRDVDCGFKLLRKEILSKIDKLESRRGAFISSELLIKAKNAGFKIAEVGVSHFERIKDTKSKTGRSLGVILGSFRDLVRLRAKLK